MVQFRKIEDGLQASKRTTALKSGKLSFAKLTEGSHTGHSLGRPPIPDKTRKLVYDKAVTYMGDVFKALRNGTGFNLNTGFEIIKNIAAFDHPQDPVLIMALHKDDWHAYVSHHPVNVAIFAVKIAAHLGYERSKQMEIGMAGLFHDIGMAAIPDNILFKKARLNNDEVKVFKRRPDLSSKILRKMAPEHAYLAECAAQIYERIDGSGYPRGLKAGEVHEYAQLIGLLDMYESLIHTRPQRGRRTPFAAVKEIINASKNHFRKDHLKALLSIFTAFPIYSYVRLNSDAIGKVIETYPDQPLRPKIQILYDSQKRKVLTEKVVALPEDPLLHIIDSISELEIRQMTNT